ncbi:hypothetical protein [Actinomycetospora succinea]|uniref:hypothetical protein n=1 Tax=Actinomycetospora succinea TaxID=663603 RepID=UPI0031E9F638
MAVGRALPRRPPHPTARRHPAPQRRSAARRGSRIARWSPSRDAFVPQLCDDDWDLTSACAQLEEATAVPARRWCELAQAFLRELDDDLVWRGRPVDPFQEL